MLKNPNLTVPILTKSDNFRCLYCAWITIWRNIESLVWKSNLYFVSPGCFWRNWSVLHFRLELHDRNYWLRPKLTAWLVSSTFHFIWEKIETRAKAINSALVFFLSLQCCFSGRPPELKLSTLFLRLGKLILCAISTVLNQHSWLWPEFFRYLGIL